MPFQKVFGVQRTRITSIRSHIPCGGEHLTFSNKLNVHLKFAFNRKMLVHMFRKYYQTFAYEEAEELRSIRRKVGS